MATESKPTVGIGLVLDRNAVSGLAETLEASSAPSETALVEAVRAGDRAAMQLLYQRYHRRLFAVMTRICGAQDAEELLQDVFLRAFSAMAKFRGDCMLSTWMYRLAVNAA